VIFISIFLIGVIALFIINNVDFDSEIKQITPFDLQDKLKERDILIIDVRDELEYRTGHIPGAINIPLALLSDNYKQLPNKPIIMVCKTGKRSMIAVSFLKDQGYDVLMNLKGGIKSWQDANFELV